MSKKVTEDNSATDQRYELLCNALLQAGIKAAISEDDGSAYPMADYHLLYAQPEGKEKVEIFAEYPFGGTNYIPTIAQAIEVAKSHHDVSTEEVLQVAQNGFSQGEVPPVE